MTEPEPEVTWPEPVRLPPPVTPQALRVTHRLVTFDGGATWRQVDDPAGLTDGDGAACVTPGSIDRGQPHAGVHGEGGAVAEQAVDF